MLESADDTVKAPEDLESAYPLNELAAGYPRLSGYMERIPEVAIFRRFAGLNARRLLYLQAELLQLQKELETTECADKHSSDEDRQNYSVDWFWLKQSMDFKDEIKTRQWNLVQEIMPKLKEFSK
jgi:hypothetical protein